MIKQDLEKLILQQGILPLYFHKDSIVSVETMKALYRAGIRAIEYTNRGKEALENFVKMRKMMEEFDSKMYLGIGTIKDRKMAEHFIKVGCDFIVSPGLSEDVAEEADKNGILWIPGCMTPSEIMRAEYIGATIIKIFPSNILGSSFIASIKPLFPHLIFMATGGVEIKRENFVEWRKAGTSILGMGSKLISENLMEEGNYDEIEENVKQALKLFNSIYKI